MTPPPRVVAGLGIAIARRPPSFPSLPPTIVTPTPIAPPGYRIRDESKTNSILRRTPLSNPPPPSLPPLPISLSPSPPPPHHPPPPPLSLSLSLYRYTKQTNAFSLLNSTRTHYSRTSFRESHGPHHGRAELAWRSRDVETRSLHGAELVARAALPPGDYRTGVTCVFCCVHNNNNVISSSS